MIDRLPSAPSGPHLAPDELYRAQNEPRSPRGEAVLAHAALCATCSEELLRQEAFDHPEPLTERKLEEAWARFQRGGTAPSSAAPRRWRPALMLAATLAAAVLGLSLWRFRAQPATPVPIAGPAVETTRGGTEPALAWTPNGTIAAPPNEFVFAPDGDTLLRVTVFDEKRSYSWTSESSATGHVPFPREERAKLRPGVDYYWTVLTEQATPSDETARNFRIAPQRP